MSEWRVPGYAEMSELGRGASGRVVAAVEQSSGQRVAVKYLADRLADDGQFRAAFRSEAAILAGLKLPHVARIRGFVESADGAAIIMDLVTGVTLRQILARFGPAGPRAALTVLKGSLLGLAGAHRAGIVHRDYKPENVIVDQTGSSMLVDFGIALRSGTAGEPAGTPGYAAPEQWEGAPASAVGDIYAAGVTFAECVTGVEPPRGLAGAPPRAAAPPAIPGSQGDDALGPRLTWVIARATAADPAVRPADAAVLLAKLQEAADERYGPGWEETGRNDLARSVAALLLLAAGGAAGGVAAGTPATSAGATAQGPATSATTVLDGARRFGRAAGAGSGRGRAIMISAAAVVIAGAAVAIAVTGRHHHPPRGAPGPSGQSTIASPINSHGPKRTADPSPTPGGLAVNPANPCTWLTRADFARYGVSSGPLTPGGFPGGWKACRNGKFYVGFRSAFLSGCPPITGVPFTCTRVSVPGASSAQYLVVSNPAESELHAERGGLQYSIGVPSGAAGLATLIKLMELVLTRTAAAG